MVSLEENKMCKIYLLVGRNSLSSKSVQISLRNNFHSKGVAISNQSLGTGPTALSYYCLVMNGFCMLLYSSLYRKLPKVAEVLCVIQLSVVLPKQMLHRCSPCAAKCWWNEADLYTLFPKQPKIKPNLGNLVLHIFLGNILEYTYKPDV